jgi:hypothetical protein
MAQILRPRSTPFDPAKPEPDERYDAVRGLASGWVQGAYVAALWAYSAPFIWLAPFLASPPLWISALALAPEHADPRPADPFSATARNPRAP